MICDNCESVFWSEAVDHFVRVQAPCPNGESGPLAAVPGETPDEPFLPLAA
jgi:hypothetical protein